MIDRRGLIGGGVTLAAMAGLIGRARAAGAPVVNRIRLEDDRVWIAAKIGDTGPHLFVIDTGGSLSIINEEFADKIGMKVINRRVTAGVGGSRLSAWYDAGTVTLESGVNFPHMLFVGTHLFGTKAMGTFGVGMFNTYDSDLDFVKGEWRLYKDGRPDFDGFTKLPTRFFDLPNGGQWILASATIDGVPGEFIVDTGSPGTLLLGGKMAARSGLWDAGKPYVPTQSRGIGTKGVPSRLVRGQRLAIGAFDFERPLVGVCDPSAPWIDTDGLIGLEALSRLHLTTQVSEHKLWAAWNGKPSPEPAYYGSGLWLDDKAGKVTVGDVGTGSPAAAAGIKRGDLLHGRFKELLRAITRPMGSEIPLSVESGGVKRDVRLTLSAYL